MDANNQPESATIRRHPLEEVIVEEVLQVLTTVIQSLVQLMECGVVGPLGRAVLYHVGLDHTREPDNATDQHRLMEEIPVKEPITKIRIVL